MRAFLAIPLPAALAEAARRTIAVLGVTEARWRVVAEGNMHLTMRFLGEVDASRLDALDPSFAAAAGTTGRLSLRVAGAGAFPNARRPKTIWLGIEEIGAQGALGALAQRLEAAARAAGFAPEPRGFFPHVTLARARGDERTLADLATVGSLGDFEADALILYRSITDPRGARYDARRHYPLDAGPAR